MSTAHLVVLNQIPVSSIVQPGSFISCPGVNAGAVVQNVLAIGIPGSPAAGTIVDVTSDFVASVFVNGFILQQSAITNPGNYNYFALVLQ